MSENSSSTDLGGDAGTTAALDANKAAPKRREAKDLSKADTTLSGKKVRIKIPDTKEESQKGPVYVGLNGNGYQIPRGVDVIIPVEVREVLDNAVEKTYDATDGKQVLTSEMPRHSYQFQGEVKA